jgi:hypothetical protein
MTETTWSELFPNGRHIFYEGDEPLQFAREILAEFGSAPNADERWAYGYGFHCPPQHLDAIYGSFRWALGS